MLTAADGISYAACDATISTVMATRGERFWGETKTLPPEAAEALKRAEEQLTLRGISYSFCVLNLDSGRMATANTVQRFYSASCVKAPFITGLLQAGYRPTDDMYLAGHNSDNEALAIISSEEFIQNNEAYFNTHPALQNFADALHYTTHNGDQSVGRYPDGGNDIYHFNLPTIEKTNTLLTADQFLMTDEGIMDNSGATLNLDLAQGWNWVSHPFAGTVSVNRFNSYADIIRGRSEEAAYSPSGGTMTGSLKALQPNQLYKVDMSEAHNYAFDGLTLNQRATIDLAQGWNWIGYPSMDMQPLASAFQASEINAGDIIMGQAGFSVYSDADGWIGTLSTLMPGQGYMYWTATGKKIKFTPARHTVRLRKPRQGLQSTAYGLNPHAYPNVMGAIAQLYVDDQPVDVEEFTVLAYSGDECRGVGECVDGKLFMTLYGFDGDAITLKGLDAQGDEYPIQESLDFTSAVLGTRSAPSPSSGTWPAPSR